MKNRKTAAFYTGYFVFKFHAVKVIFFVDVLFDVLLLQHLQQQQTKQISTINATPPTIPPIIGPFLKINKHTCSSSTSSSSLTSHPQKSSKMAATNKHRVRLWLLLGFWLVIFQVFEIAAFVLLLLYVTYVDWSNLHGTNNQNDHIIFANNTLNILRTLHDVIPLLSKHTIYFGSLQTGQKSEGIQIMSYRYL